jgi:hypothetical protein
MVDCRCGGGYRRWLCFGSGSHVRTPSFETRFFNAMMRTHEASRGYSIRSFFLDSALGFPCLMESPTQEVVSALSSRSTITYTAQSSGCFGRSAASKI